GEWGMGSREWVKQLTHRLTPHSLFPTPHSPPSLRTLFICAYEGLTIQTMIAVNEQSHQSSFGYRDLFAFHQQKERRGGDELVIETPLRFAHRARPDHDRPPAREWHKILLPGDAAGFRAFCPPPFQLFLHRRKVVGRQRLVFIFPALALFLASKQASDSQIVEGLGQARKSKTLRGPVIQLFLEGGCLRGRDESKFL